MGDRIFAFSCGLFFFSGAVFASVVARDSGAQVDPLIWVGVFFAYAFVTVYWPKKKKAHKGPPGG